MANLPVNRTEASTIQEHEDDHNALHAFHNLIDAAGDLIVGVGPDAAGKLGMGAALDVLRVNAGGTALEFAVPVGAEIPYQTGAPSSPAVGDLWVDSDEVAQSGTTRVDAKVYRSAAYNIPNGAITAIPWDAEEWDNGGFWVVGSPTRLTVPTGQGGLYLVGYSLGTDQNMLAADKRWFTGVFKNGTEVRGGHGEVDTNASGSYPSTSATVLVELAEADYVDTRVFQDSGSTKTLFLTVSALWLRRLV